MDTKEGLSMLDLIKIKVKTNLSFKTQFPLCFIPGCFVACMDDGLRIYNVDPLVEKAHYGNLIFLVTIFITKHRFILSCIVLMQC